MKQGDTVRVTVGPQAGRTGLIMRANPAEPSGWMVRFPHLPYDLPYNESELEAL